MIRVPAALPALVLIAMTVSSAQGATVVADLSDHRIEVTTGFTGARVLLFGARDGDGDVVVVLRGPPKPVVVRRKQRRLGLWLNRDEVVFEDAPGYYAVAANRPLAGIAPPTLFAEHGIGLENLVLARETEGDSGFRAALLRLMKGGGRYRETPDGVSFVDNRLFRSTFVLPADVPTGLYRADVLLIVDGVVADKRTTALNIGKTGFGAAMFDFAHAYPIAYGLVAAVVALMAGWTTGMVFRKR